MDIIEVFQRPKSKANCPKKFVPVKYPMLSGTKTSPSCHFCVHIELRDCKGGIVRDGTTKMSIIMLDQWHVGHRNYTGGSILSMSQTGSVGSRTAMAIVESQMAMEIIKMDLSRKRPQQLVVGGSAEGLLNFGRKQSPWLFIQSKWMFDIWRPADERTKENHGHQTNDIPASWSSSHTQTS